jgi:hypothetical protein
MAQFTKVNGTTQPVFALDVANGSISGTANVAAQGPVMLSGPQLQFFSLTANAALTNAGNVNGYLNNVLQAIQQTGTIAFYQAGATAGTINLAIYPSGAYTTNYPGCRCSNSQCHRWFEHWYPNCQRQRNSQLH